MKIHTLEDLFLHDLSDLYNAEKQLVKALSRMARAAVSTELQEAFQEHRGQTERQVERLEEIFSSLGQKARGKKCKGIEGIIEEGNELISGDVGDVDEECMDAALIGAAQRAEHYEIAAYGTVRTYARMLGHHDAERLLQKTLNEEAEADKKLTRLAETLINVKAAQHA